jgi:hypothetical protein
MAGHGPLSMSTGSHAAYQWLVSDYDLEDVLRLCPGIVLNKHIAVTSCDSGSLNLNDRERAAGWVSRQGIAYSPRVRAVEELPREQFDEWYVFSDPTDFGQLAGPAKNVFEARLDAGEIYTFVNFGGFALHHPEMEDLVALFWMQLDRVRPETYIAEGDYLTIVISDKTHFAAVHQALRSLRR